MFGVLVLGMCHLHRKCGYTVVEMMVTILIVAILTTTVGTVVVKLLTLQERDREEAYIRETLTNVCGEYADSLSLGSFICTNNLHGIDVTYRSESGGVSFETGRVSHVVKLISAKKNSSFELNVNVVDRGNMISRLLCHMQGNAALIPLAGNLVSCDVIPLNAEIVEDAALACLQVTAQYKVRDDSGKLVDKETTVERVVRLWNWDKEK